MSPLLVAVSTREESMSMTRSELGFFIRRLIRASRSATLSTSLIGADGWPYGSLVTVAIAMDGSPLLLFSTLSDHTRNVEQDNRASLLFERASRHSNPQRGPRVALLGKIRRTKNQAHAERFLNIHPEAKLYAKFGDFGFFRMTIDRAHWVGGFAQAQWLSGRFIISNGKAVRAISKAAVPIIEHMNEDHAEALDLYVNKILKRRGKGWKMIGIDLDGIDLMLEHRRARLSFAKPIANKECARATLVELAAYARSLIACE